MHIHTAIADLERSLQRIDDTRGLCGARAKAILYYLKQCGIFMQETRVALRFKQLFDFCGSEVVWYRQRKGDGKPWIARRGRTQHQCLQDALRRIT